MAIPVKPGFYAIAGRRSALFICGRMYQGGNVEITPGMAGDPYVIHLVDTFKLLKLPDMKALKTPTVVISATVAAPAPAILSGSKSFTPVKGSGRH